MISGSTTKRIPHPIGFTLTSCMYNQPLLRFLRCHLLLTGSNLIAKLQPSNPATVGFGGVLGDNRGICVLGYVRNIGFSTLSEREIWRICQTQNWKKIYYFT